MGERRSTSGFWEGTLRPDVLSESVTGRRSKDDGNQVVAADLADAIGEPEYFTDFLGNRVRVVHPLEPTNVYPLREVAAGDPLRDAAK